MQFVYVDRTGWNCQSIPRLRKIHVLVMHEKASNVQFLN